MIPSTLENRKKRIVIKDIDGIKGKTYKNFEDEFEYFVTENMELYIESRMS